DTGCSNRRRPLVGRLVGCSSANGTGPPACPSSVPGSQKPGWPPPLGSAATPILPAAAPEHWSAGETVPFAAATPARREVEQASQACSARGLWEFVGSKAVGISTGTSATTTRP